MRTAIMLLAAMLLAGCWRVVAVPLLSIECGTDADAAGDAP